MLTYFLSFNSDLQATAGSHLEQVGYLGESNQELWQ